MCYFLSAYVEQASDNSQMRKICDKYSLLQWQMECEFDLPKLHSVNCYRLTTVHCDCGTALGGGKKAKSDELGKYLSFFRELKDCNRACYIAILKHWAGSDSGIFKAEQIPIEKIHVDDLDLDFLANLHDEVLYKIQLFPSYYQEINYDTD